MIGLLILIALIVISLAIIHAVVHPEQDETPDDESGVRQSRWR